MRQAFRNTFLTIASILLLSSCGNGRKLTREQVIDYGEIGYADIVSFIVQGYQNHWDGISPEEMGLSPVYSYRSPYAGFTKKDIDGDGFDELLIGDQFENGSYTLYDIYCFNKKDASLIHLASGGERDSFIITGNGTIVENGSNSAEDSFTRGYRIKNDKLVEESRGWDKSLMMIELEKFSELAKARQLCGGYSEQREPTEEEMELFRSVTGTEDMVFTPLSVATQVVAGINYRFWCRYQEGEIGGHCTVIIFKPLPGRGEPSLRSIEKE